MLVLSVTTTKTKMAVSESELIFVILDGNNDENLGFDENSDFSSK